MPDPTESIRRKMVQEINSSPSTREGLEQDHGQVWDTKELQQDFVVHGFLAPFVNATRKSDGKHGTLMFTHMPRFYYGWEEIDG